MKVPYRRGVTYGALTSICFVKRERGKRFWKFICECGKIIIRPFSDVKGGNTRSCVCLTKYFLHTKLKIHGLRATPTYQTWKSTLRRVRRHKVYLNRGIKVC